MGVFALHIFFCWVLSRTTQETMGHVEPASRKSKLAHTQWHCLVHRSGRSQASKHPDQQPRLTWSLSSDKGEFERAGRNLIPDERAPKPDVLALWNLKRTDCSWS